MVKEYVNNMSVMADFINKTTMVKMEPFNDIFVTEELLRIFRLINYVIIMGPVCVFGTIFNIINIIVFINIGFKETVNISLLALAVADVCSIIPLIWMSITYNPLLANHSGWMDSQAVQVIVGWAHVCFSRITGGLTAFIAFERYLCVALPLKIKTIITPRRTVVIVITNFIVIIAGIVPEYSSFGLHLYVSPENNITYKGMYYYDNGREIENFVLSFATFCQLTCFLTVIVSTGGLVRTLSIKSKWRLSTSNTAKDTTVMARERKTVVMVLFLSIIFIISYLPVSMNLVLMMTFKEYSIQGKYNNLLIATATFYLCLESINSSVNIFVYYNMSSKYKAVILSINFLKRK